jgi:hypothetical protein
MLCHRILKKRVTTCISMFGYEYESESRVAETSAWRQTMVRALRVKSSAHTKRSTKCRIRPGLLADAFLEHAKHVHGHAWRRRIQSAGFP